MEPPKIKRKLAAILYADVAGYSRLTEDDEEGTHRMLVTFLDAFGASIEGHSGRVVHIAGDAVLADFASVLDALSCAVDVRRDFKTRNESLSEDRKLQFRIGVNLGDVMVDRDEIYGDGVNVAARLQSVADPGGICISASVRDQIKNKLGFGFEYLGEQKVKNIAEPVRVYRVQLDPGAVSVETLSQDDRPPAEAAPAPGDRSQAKAARIRRFYNRAAQLGLIVAFLFVIDLITTPDKWWVHWPALVVALALALRALKEFGPGIRDEGSVKGDVAGDMRFATDTRSRGNIAGDVTVAPGLSVEVKGNIGKNVTVESGAILEVRGNIGDNVTIRPDAVIDIRGNIARDVINQGGTLRLRGKLGGSEKHVGADAGGGTGAAGPDSDHTARAPESSAGS
ncbi:MAG: adenylate/guanylate cyclase domain-containing protein [Rhodospirillales bacterium]|nr:adenylate/guanylate cyclase domain-containing protein [Rhodospirillales bacterium]